MLILLRYGFAVDPWSTAKLVADTLFSTVVAIGVPWLLGIAVGQLPAVLAGQPATGLLVSAIAIVVLLIAETVVSSAQLTTFEDLSLRTERNVLTRLTRLHLDPVRVDHLQDADFGDRTQRARDLVWQIDQGLFSMARPVGELLTLAGATVLLGVSVGWPGAAVLAVATVAVGVLRMRLADREMDVWFGHTEDQRHADFAFGLGTGLAPAEVRIFGLQRWVGQRFWDYLTAAWVGYWRQGVTSALWILVADAGAASYSAGAARRPVGRADHARRGARRDVRSRPVGRGGGVRARGRGAAGPAGGEDRGTPSERSHHPDRLRPPAESVPVAAGLRRRARLDRDRAAHGAVEARDPPRRCRLHLPPSDGGDADRSLVDVDARLGHGRGGGERHREVDPGQAAGEVVRPELRRDHRRRSRSPHDRRPDLAITDLGGDPRSTLPLPGPRHRRDRRSRRARRRVGRRARRRG